MGSFSPTTGGGGALHADELRRAASYVMRCFQFLEEGLCPACKASLNTFLKPPEKKSASGEVCGGRMREPVAGNPEKAASRDVRGEKMQEPVAGYPVKAASRDIRGERMQEPVAGYPVKAASRDIRGERMQEPVAGYPGKEKAAVRPPAPVMISTQEPTGLGSTKKPRLNWTPERHSKFLAALESCTKPEPTSGDVLEALKVLGETEITRPQVTSHLQKHRLKQNKAKK